MKRNNIDFSHAKRGALINEPGKERITIWLDEEVLAWFRREVEAALVEANDPATRWLSNEQVERESAAWRRRVLAGVEGQH